VAASASSGAPVGEALAGRTVTDYIGREVAVPSRVDTVAVMYNYIGQVAVLLGGGDKLRAVVGGMQRDELLLRKVPGIADMPVPSRGGSINIETLLEISPDVALIRYSTAVSPGEIEKLELSGLTWAVVDYFDMEQQIESIQTVGALIDKDEAAARYIDHYEKTIAFVRERTSAIPDEERVRVYHSVNEVLRTNHSNEISYYVLEDAGCVNVAAGFATEEMGVSVHVSVEQIYLWDPDIIIANEFSAVESFRSSEAYAGLRAVRENRVYQLPVAASRWGHPGSLETPIATLYIAKLLYPQYFEDIDIREEIINFYADFWEIDLDEDEVDSIISGRGMRQARDGG